MDSEQLIDSEFSILDGTIKSFLSQEKSLFKMTPGSMTLACQRVKTAEHYNPAFSQSVATYCTVLLPLIQLAIQFSQSRNRSRDDI